MWKSDALLDFLRIVAFFFAIGGAMMLGRWMDGKEPCPPCSVPAWITGGNDD